MRPFSFVLFGYNSTQNYFTTTEQKDESFYTGNQYAKKCFFDNIFVTFGRNIFSTKVLAFRLCLSYSRSISLFLIIEIHSKSCEGQKG